MCESLRELFVATGAILEGHFQLSSGMHSTAYIQCAKVLEHPDHAERLGAALAERLGELAVDRVVAPPMGGVLIGHEVARSLRVPFLFPERDAEGGLTLRRGFTLRSGERVLVVEDVITTGRTTVEVLKLLHARGAEPVGLAALVDRSDNALIGGLRPHALIEMPLPLYTPDTCPLCAQGVPAVRPGSRTTS